MITVVYDSLTNESFRAYKGDECTQWVYSLQKCLDALQKDDLYRNPKPMSQDTEILDFVNRHYGDGHKILVEVKTLEELEELHPELLL